MAVRLAHDTNAAMESKRMEDVGCLRKADGRYEFHFEELGLSVRGAQPEWVLTAATEIIMEAARAESESALMELRMLHEMGEADEVDVDIAANDAHERFELVPQCIISLGAIDYHWVAPEGRRDPGELTEALRRIIDLSKTRNGTFLANVEGVDTRNI
jgi:hypothetical protein